MPVRRSADPTSVQYVWDAIRSANAQRQMADFHRITKYLQRVGNCSQEQAELYLKQTLKDGLVVSLNKVTAKGSKAGAPVESYKIPVQELPVPETDGKDWYCIDCHLAGDVILCRMCHRVYHAECANKQRCNFKNLINTFRELNSPAKRFSGIPENDSSFHQEAGVLDIENTNPNNNSCNEVEKEKSADRTSEQDTTANSANVSLDSTIEKELEKMEESCLANANGSTCNVSNTSEGNIDVSKSSDLPEIDKENNSLSSSKSEQIAQILGDDDDDDDDDSSYDATLCSICNTSKIEHDLPIETEELNYLLSFVHSRIKSWLPADITNSMSTETKEWMNESEVAWRATQLFYKPMDMVIIESKLQAQEYTKVSEFQADVLTVQHNVAVYHGIESQEYAASDYMLDDCRYDISELLNCADCYRHSNEKVNNKWFCLPCRVPHRLVWAKQKGYPYWPAKVIKETDDACDVRFFGGKYERSILPKTYIKPITASLSDQQVKKNAPYNKAVSELHIHQKMLENPELAQDYILLSRKRKLSKPSKSPPISKLSKPGPKKARRSSDLQKDVYEFLDSPANVEAQAKVAAVARRKRSTSPSAKVKPVRTSEYPTRRAVQNKINKSKAAAAAATAIASAAAITAATAVGIVKNGANPSTADLNSMLPDIGDDNEFSLKDGDFEFVRSYDGSQEEVSSSTEQLRAGDENYASSDGVMPETERQYSESVEKTRRKLEQCRDKKQLIKIALECMQAEIDRINTDHDDYLKKVFELHNAQISETKKKQWCYNCEQDAIYHCCWNTAYCSPTCQQQHWQAEHKKVCRRKR